MTVSRFVDSERGIELYYELKGTGEEKVIFIMGVCTLLPS